MSKASREERRADFMSQLLAQKAGSVLDCMLMTDAIVRYCETGEIANLSPGDVSLAPRGRDRQAARV